MTSQLVRTDDGLELNVRLEGEASRPVVMLGHSIGCDLTMWDAQAAALQPRFRVLRFDRRGHGRSQVPAGPADIARLGHDVLAILDALALERVSYVGISQGGMEALWLGAHAPARIERLVVANSAPWLGMPERLQAAIDTASQQGAAGMAVLASGFLERWMPADWRSQEPAAWEALLRGFAGMSPEGFAACAAVLRDVDLRPVLGRITAPTLVVAGGAEGAAVLEGARALAGSLPAGRLAVIPGGGHLTSLDHPAEFNRLLLDFLAA